MNATALAKEAIARHGSYRAAAAATGVDHATLWRMAHGVGVPEDHIVRRLEAAPGKGKPSMPIEEYAFGLEDEIKGLKAENARLAGELAECRAALAAAEARAERAEQAHAHVEGMCLIYRAAMWAVIAKPGDTNPIRRVLMLPDEDGTLHDAALRGGEESV